MSRGGSALEKRREELRRRAAAERDEIAAAFAPWQRPLDVVGRGLHLVRAAERLVPMIGVGLSAALLSRAFGGSRRPRG